MAKHSSTKLHAVLVIPVPLHGHVTPAINLAFRLAAAGLAVTFVNAEPKLTTTTTTTATSYADLFAGARSEGLEVRYELVTEGVPDSFDMSRNRDQIIELFLHHMPRYVGGLLERFVGGGERCVSCLVADSFYVWPSEMAARFGVPFVSFWTEAATVFNLYCHADLLVKNGHFDMKGNERSTITYIPGIPSIEPTELPSYLQDQDLSTPIHQRLLKIFTQTKKADFILSNTVQELEPNCTNYLQDHRSFYAIGPIIRNPLIPTTTPTPWPETECTHWLDKQPHRSVLYMSFGSLYQPSKRDMGQLLRGVVDSKARFLWVRPQEPEYSVDIDDFLKKGRGIAVSWCDQREVLGHPAIALFVTHCGWNSVLESVWCKVPMLCFPLFSDQFTNCRLVVKEWGVGVEVGVGGRIRNEDVSEVIDGFVGDGGGGSEVRRRVGEVRKVMERAVGPGGSSRMNFDRFVEDLGKWGDESTDHLL